MCEWVCREQANTSVSLVVGQSCQVKTRATVSWVVMSSSRNRVERQVTRTISVRFKLRCAFRLQSFPALVDHIRGVSCICGKRVCPCQYCFHISGMCNTRSLYVSMCKLEFEHVHTAYIEELLDFPLGAAARLDTTCQITVRLANQDKSHVLSTDG
jgi:hypothetical protein